MINITLYNITYLSFLQGLTSNNSLVFTLTLYQQITVQAKQLTDKVQYFFSISVKFHIVLQAKDGMTAVIQSCSVLSNEVSGYIIFIII